MIQIALNIATAATLAAMAMCLWRLLRGPSAPDRILALDTLSINAIALVMLQGIRMQSDVFFEAALLIAMTGFVATVSLSRQALDRSVIE